MFVSPSYVFEAFSPPPPALPRPPLPFLSVQPPKDPTFLVKHTGTIGAEELLEEMKADPADVESEYLEMASYTSTHKYYVVGKFWVWYWCC